MSCRGAASFSGRCGPGGEHYLASLDWVGASTLAVQRLPRQQNTVEVLLADSGSGASRVAFRESDECWVDVHPMHWLEGGEQFVWLSDRSGFAQLYIVSAVDGEMVPLVAGREQTDVVSIVSVEAGWVFFISTDPSQLSERYLWRVSLSGAPSRAERLTPTDGGGTHSYSVAPGGRFAVHRYEQLTLDSNEAHH